MKKNQNNKLSKIKLKTYLHKMFNLILTKINKFMVKINWKKYKTNNNIIKEQNLNIIKEKNLNILNFHIL